MNIKFPTLDGVNPSFADISVKCKIYKGPFLLMDDIKSIDCGAAVNIGVQRSGGRVMARGTGDTEHTGSIELYRSGYQKLLRAAAAVAPRRAHQALLSLVVFDLDVQHSPPGSLEIYQYILRGCRVMGKTVGSAEGPDLQTVVLPLSIVESVDIVDGIEVAMG